MYQFWYFYPLVIEFLVIRHLLHTETKILKGYTETKRLLDKIK